ncbi:hypothetical protein HN51_057391 [Arachis hypogaea]
MASSEEDLVRREQMRSQERREQQSSNGRERPGARRRSRGSGERRGDGGEHAVNQRRIVTEVTLDRFSPSYSVAAAMKASSARSSPLSPTTGDFCKVWNLLESSKGDLL